MRTCFGLVLFATLAVGCGDISSPKSDDDTGWSEDGGTEDGGTEDGGTEDAGTEDAGTEDGGTEDAGTEDGGTEDGGTEDGGTEDGGTADGGTEDGGTEDGGTEDGGTEDGGTDAGAVEVTIAEIQGGDVSEGTTVTVVGAVTTTGLNSDEDGFFAQDIGGGAWSGIYVYVYAEVAAELSDLEPGTVIDITGEVSEFHDRTDITVTDISDITVTPITASVTIDDIGATPDDWESWEGCLVVTGEVSVTGEAEESGSVPLNNGAYLGDDFYSFGVVTGATYEAITGVVDYQSDQYTLLPRSGGDIVVTSSDGEDGGTDDGGGDTDGGTTDGGTTDGGTTDGGTTDGGSEDGGSDDGGSDDGGTTGDGEIVSGTSVSSIQLDTYALGTTVTIEGVVATTGLNPAEYGFFVQDIGGGPWSGIFIYLDPELERGALFDELGPGSVLDITGVVTDFDGLTDLVVSELADITLTSITAAPTADAVTGTPDDWEVWEGCLITTDALTVTGPFDAYGSAPLSNGASIDDMFVDFEISEDGSISSLTGVVTYTHDAYRILPRTVEDIDW